MDRKTASKNDLIRHIEEQQRTINQQGAAISFMRAMLVILLDKHGGTASMSQAEAMATQGRILENSLSDDGVLTLTFGKPVDLPPPPPGVTILP